MKSKRVRPLLSPRNLDTAVTETTGFGVTTSDDGVGPGPLANRPFPADSAEFNDILFLGHPPAQDPPTGGDYYIPDSDVGKAMFMTGVVTSSTAGTAFLTWIFKPIP